MFTLGIPSSPTTAVLMGAFMMNGLVPGPQLFRERRPRLGGDREPVRRQRDPAGAEPAVRPAVGRGAEDARTRCYWRWACSVFCVLGVYSLGNSVFDVGAMLGFGVLGHAFRKLDLP